MARRPGTLGSWAGCAGLAACRTISGRLIIGLVLLLAMASVAVSVATQIALSHSLMSSLDNQLQAATQRRLRAAPGPDPARQGGDRHVRGDGQRSTVTYSRLVPERCSSRPGTSGTLVALRPPRCHRSRSDRSGAGGNGPGQPADAGPGLPAARAIRPRRPSPGR